MRKSVVQKTLVQSSVLFGYSSFSLHGCNQGFEQYESPREILTSLENCRSAGGFNHIVIEKPFGRDLETCKQLNNTILNEFTEEEIYVWVLERSSSLEN